MLEIICKVFVFLGAALMVYNIYGFVRFTRDIRQRKSWGQSSAKLYIPIVLIAMFLVGYLIVGFFGNPDLVMTGILFFGSIFVFIMYQYLTRVTYRISEGEKLEAKLMAAEESNRTKMSFLASISHEMRTPLNVILGMADLAMKNDDVPDEAMEQLGKIELSAQRLLGLINNVLDMNSIESGSMTIKNEDFSLADALKQVGIIARAICEEKGLDFTMEVSYQETCHYLGDEMQIKSVLMSILDNAVKYTDVPGAVSFSISKIDGDEKKHVIQFAISDTGIGMDSEFLPHVFEAFTQEDASSTNRFGGGGLSLAVAKNTLELMGGSIAVESEKGVGSTFTVVLPLFCIAPTQNPKNAPNVKPLETLDGRRVLIVEDLPENAEIVADLLELEGVETEHAENGQIALDMIENSPARYYDAILMDLRMPVMDGLEATRIIRNLGHEDSSTVPIIALTANAYESDVKESLAAGMNVHLAKPTDSDTLYDTLKQTIARATQSDEGSEA